MTFVSRLLRHHSGRESVRPREGDALPRMEKWFQATLLASRTHTATKNFSSIDHSFPDDLHALRQIGSVDALASHLFFILPCFFSRALGVQNCRKRAENCTGTTEIIGDKSGGGSDG